MRKEIIKGKTHKEVAKLCPWAIVTFEIEGGHVAFESWETVWDYLDQIEQKG